MRTRRKQGIGQRVSRTAGGAPAFTPVSIAGLALWLDAGLSSKWQDATGTTPATADDAPVRRWDDLSGNGRHATAPSDATRPLLKLAIQNGLPVLRTDGSNDHLVATLTLSQPFTLFAVYKLSSFGDVVVNDVIFADAGTAAILGTSASVGFETFMFFGGAVTYAPQAADGVFAQMTVGVSGASSFMRENGAQEATGDPGATGITAVGISATSGGIRPVGGDFCAVLLYDSLITGDDQAAVEAYLKDRFGTP